MLSPRGPHRFFLLATLLLSAGAQQPAPDPAPLPDLPSLIARVRQHADALVDLRKKYICKEVVTADEFDAKAHKSTHTDEFQVFFVEKTEIRRRLSHDGKPLSPADQKKEEDRVRRAISDARAHNVPKNQPPALRASALLRLTTTRNAHRETINNRPTIVFDYQGNPAAKAENIPEQVMKKLVGTVWIDEQDAAIVRVTGTLQDNYHVLGGMLVNVKKGSRFDITTTRVNDEIWFTRDLTAHVDGRILLFKGFNGEAHVAFSDYRKLNTTVTLLPGSQVITENGTPIPQPNSPPSTNSPPSSSPTGNSTTIPTRNPTPSPTGQQPAPPPPATPPATSTSQH